MLADKTRPAFPDTSFPVPRNRWYVAAFADEVTDQPMARTILGERIVFYRTEQGVAVALSDYCAHRAMALSKGKRVNGDRLQCPYHGMEYGPDGQCRLVPSQEHAPRQMRVHAYPLVQRWEWLWIWTGDPARADEGLIPDHSEFGFVEGSGYWKAKFWRMDFHSSAQLVQENLLDVSHVTFLHEGMVDNGALNAAPSTTTVEGDVVIVSRTFEDVMTGAYAQTFGMEEGSRVIRTNIGRTYVPSLNVSINVFEFPHEPGRPARNFVSPMAITPATDQSCHYFFTVGADYGEEPVGEAHRLRGQALWDLILTDKEAAEYIQQAYNTFGAATPDVSVRADEGAVRYRRILARQCLHEQRVADEALAR
ncbi:MAG TPA: aromatic ring-hydroxylating dioxygenase subunit alpha [Novosphingobium sp.]|nr:aromatic ring-hydroxylating dioxygenase subunit alpha [Novosphingobium sp.]